MSLRIASSSLRSRLSRGNAAESTTVSIVDAVGGVHEVRRVVLEQASEELVLVLGILRQRADRDTHGHDRRRHADRDWRHLRACGDQVGAAVVFEVAVQLQEEVLYVLGGSRHGRPERTGSARQGRGDPNTFRAPDRAVFAPRFSLPQSRASLVRSPSWSVAIHPGDILAGYRVTRLLGRGGMGEVWAARSDTTGREVAIKVLLARAAMKPDLVRRFQREAKIARRDQEPLRLSACSTWA